jgi:hypothetical protein
MAAIQPSLVKGDCQHASTQRVRGEGTKGT